MKAWEKILFGAAVLAASFAGGFAAQGLLVGPAARAASEGTEASAAVRSEVRARAVVIVDENGKERLRLGPVAGTTDAGAKAGEPDAPEKAGSDLTGLQVKDEAGVTRITLVAGVKTGAGLSLHGPNGKQRIGIGADAESAGIGLNDAGGIEHISIGASNDGKNGGMEATGGKDSLAVGMGFGPEGCGLSLRDAKGRSRAGIGMPPNAGPGFTANDETGKEIWRAP